MEILLGFRGDGLKKPTDVLLEDECEYEEKPRKEEGEEKVVELAIWEKRGEPVRREVAASESL